MKPKKPIVFSGVQPSGNPHIGNYLGAFQHWVAGQEEKFNIFCLVDLHAISVPQNPKVLKRDTKKLAALLLAIGIDPEKSALFIQSQNQDHTQLAWILNCFTPMGWMNRMTQYKEKKTKQKEIISVGLFDYPVLMAADILLYETDEVPVGEDQKQHVEIARDIARRFNSIYGMVFKLPEAKIEELSARIMSLKNPLEKMSKSDRDKSASVFLLDSPDEIFKKIKSAVTDSGTEIIKTPEKPAISNLLDIYSAFSQKSIKEVEGEYKNSNYQKFKEDLAEVVIESLKPVQRKYQEMTSDPSSLDKILENSLQKIKPLSEKTLKKVQEKIGLG